MGPVRHMRILIGAWFFVAMAGVCVGGGDCPTRFVFTGTHGGGLLGEPSTGAGDVNGDGVPDLLVGARGEGSSDEGHAYLYSGIDGSVLFMFTGESANDEFGSMLAALPDLDGDLLPEIMAGASRSDAAGTDSGRAYIYSSSNLKLLYELTGKNPGDFFGISGCGIGDLDGDGVGDFFIGAASATANGHNRAGKLYLYSGRTGTLVRSFDGVNTDDTFGSVVAGCADVDADGKEDFLVSALGVNTSAGRVYAYSGGNFSLLFTRDGIQGFAGLGVAIGPAGDVNGDGQLDVMMSEPLITNGYAAIYFATGRDGTVIHTLRSTVIGDGFGVGLADLGDIDGDGKDDYLVGAPTADTDTRVDNGQALVYSGSDWSTLRSFAGEGGGDDLGRYVANVGDLDKDGLDDLIIGAGRFSGSDVGRAYVYQTSSAAWYNYGDGFAGTKGIPNLTASAPPVLGTTISLFVDNSWRSSTNGYLFAGTDQAYLPSVWGGVLLVDPTLVVAIPLARGTNTITESIPGDPSYAGSVFDLQVLEIDPGARGGVSFSPGLQLVLGM